MWKRTGSEKRKTPLIALTKCYFFHGNTKIMVPAVHLRHRHVPRTSLLYGAEPLGKVFELNRYVRATTDACRRWLSAAAAFTVTRPAPQPSHEHDNTLLRGRIAFLRRSTHWSVTTLRQKRLISLIITIFYGDSAQVQYNYYALLIVFSCEQSAAST